MRIFMDASTGSGGQTEVYGFQPQNSIFATTCQGGFASTNRMSMVHGTKTIRR
jgi:hypothetical protein